MRLTELTACGGCAAKLGADLLGELLPAFARQDVPPDLLVGLGQPDDAAVYALAPGMAVLATADFFPPIVDDPFTFGAIAAANAANDIFAMGGHVIFGLNLAAVPESMPREAVKAIFAGGMDKLREAGGVVAGGHTIVDPEPKYGMVVIGLADPDRLLRKSAARAGDVLILTKPLGTGLIVSGARQGAASDAALDAAIASMLDLNRAPAEVLVANGVSAATDVTGFGLLGHALEMAVASGCRLAIWADALPILDGAAALAASEVTTSGAEHNRRYVASYASDVRDVDPVLEALAYDPQTSGGLLAAVSPASHNAIKAAFEGHDLECWEIGMVQEGIGVALSRLKSE